MVDHQRVSDLLVAAEAYLDDVRRFAGEIGRDSFLSDRGEQYRIEFPLQQAIQIAIDLAAHLLADQPGQRPATLAGLFDALADRGMLDVELAGRLAAMARFRDLLVHQHADLDAVRVWEIVDDDLTDIDLFLGQVAARLGS